MSQCCGKIPSNDDVKNIRRSISKGNAFQGDIGEQVAAQVAVNQLNLNGCMYDAPKQHEVGFDSIYRDSQGKLVIVEAKMTQASGTGALKNNKTIGKQGSPEWVRHNANLMCNPASTRYSADNARIGAEILRVGPENVRVVLIHTHPETLETTVHELSKK